MTFADKIIRYFEKLECNIALPPDVLYMNPYKEKNTMEAVKSFYRKYYSDTNDRIYIVGINPGRFGSGATGIAFTDTVRLESCCGITHNLPKTVELSSEYIYSVVEAMGGPEAFFGKFYLTSVSPVGFTKDGKNYNYYDSPAILAATLPYMTQNLKEQISWGANRHTAICLGAGKNFKHLMEVNRLMGLPFDSIVAVNHPRFVMQYRRKRIAEEIDTFVNILNRATCQ